MVLRSFLLGPPRFEAGGVAVVPPTRKALALLTYLAVEGRAARDDLCTLLWGAGRLQNLRQELHVLRKLPAAEAWLGADRTWVSVRAESDVAALLRAASAGHDPSRWWRGALGEGLEPVRAPAFHEWLESSRRHLEVARVQAAVAASRRRLDEDDEDGAWGIVAPLLEEVPSEELLWRTALEIRLRQGRTAEALTLVERATRLVDVAEHPMWAPLLAQLRGPTGRSTRALPSSARRVLQLVCLDPVRLDGSVLEAATELDAWAVTDAIQTLQDAGWLQEGTVADAEVRQQILETLAPQVREALHGRLADALTQAGGSPGRLARHLERAGRPASAAWLAEAQRTGATEAVNRAVATARSPEEACQALAEGVRVAWRRGDMEGARGTWEQLEDAAVRSQDPESLLLSTLLGALLEGRVGALEAGHARLDAAAPLAGADDPRVLAVRGALWFFAGQPEKARPLLAAGMQASDVDLRLMAVNTLGALAGLAGDVAEAERLHLEALQIARAERRTQLVMMLLNNLAATAVRRGDMETALVRLDEGARFVAQVGDVQMQAAMWFNLGNARIEAGLLGAARPVVRDLLGAPLGQPRLRGLGCRLRSDLERACGRYDEAAAWSARARAAFAGSGDDAQEQASRFNEAQARFLATRSPHELTEMGSALEALEALGRADLVADGRAELALCEPTVAGAARWVTEPASDRQWAAWIRVARLEDPTVGIPDPVQDRLGRGRSFVGLYLDALAATALAETDPVRAQELRDHVHERVEAGAQGLLTSQRESLMARVRGWLDDPVHRW